MPKEKFQRTGQQRKFVGYNSNWRNTQGIPVAKKAPEKQVVPIAKQSIEKQPKATTNFSISNNKDALSYLNSFGNTLQKSVPISGKFYNFASLGKESDFYSKILASGELTNLFYSCVKDPTILCWTKNSCSVFIDSNTAWGYSPFEPVKNWKIKTMEITDIPNELQKQFKQNGHESYYIFVPNEFVDEFDKRATTKDSNLAAANISRYATPFGVFYVAWYNC